MWVWEKKDWPNFKFKEEDLRQIEEQFLCNSAFSFGVYKHLDSGELKILQIDLMADESLKSSEIEGEILNRDSLQSSIRKNFGLKTDHRKIPPAESGISQMMADLYDNFDDELSHESLFKWHKGLMNGRSDLQDIGAYRSHKEPMQIISGRLDEPKIHFEAPPSAQVEEQMSEFINWFNNFSKRGKKPLSAVARAAIAHLYFLLIHPFEDGNGRIARALIIKALSQAIKKPLLTSLSTIIEDKKRGYYGILERSNQQLEITTYLKYFGKILLESQLHTQRLVEFLLFKTKLYQKLAGKLNLRQEKLLQRMFREGINGFEGGLSAENYIAITKTTRPTATRDLSDLVEKGALIKKGQLKGSRYYLNFDG